MHQWMIWFADSSVFIAQATPTAGSACVNQVDREREMDGWLCQLVALGFQKSGSSSEADYRVKMPML